MKVCDKTCIFCFFPIVNKYFCIAKRSLLSERSSYVVGKNRYYWQGNRKYRRNYFHFIATLWMYGHCSIV